MQQDTQSTLDVIYESWQDYNKDYKNALHL